MTHSISIRVFQFNEIIPKSARFYASVLELERSNLRAFQKLPGANNTDSAGMF